MAADLADLLDALHDTGYEPITRDERFESASGAVRLPPAFRRDQPSGWRRLLPRLYCGDDPALVPDDCRTIVETHGWTVQPMGRDAETVTVVVSRNGV
ncbi:MAG: hypothetical protein ABEI77_09995 [Halorientalis sp.]